MNNINYSFEEIKEGNIVDGKIIRISNNNIFVDIKYKVEGIIPKEEVIKYNYSKILKPDDNIKVFIKRKETKGGFVLVSKIIADKKEIFSKLKTAYEKKLPVEGKIKKQVKGGFIVDLGVNVTSFLPNSHIRQFFDGDVLEKVLPLKIIQFDEEKRNIIVSYKEYKKEKDNLYNEQIKKVYPLNEIVKVKVVQITDNEIIVEKDGVKGFIPKFEISWKKIDNLNDKFKIGDEISTKVIKNTEKIILSIKKTKQDPFEKFIKEKNIGDILEVPIVKILEKGLVVELSEELDGYIYKSEISYLKRINNLNEIFKKDEKIRAQIIKIDKEKRQVFLSLKRLEENPWPKMEERYPIGARVIGVVKEIKEGEGAFIELEENIDAFIHISNISWFNFNKIDEVLKIGEKREFKILGIDKNKYRLLLGLKQLTSSPWVTFINKYKEGDDIEVKVSEIDNNYITCEIIKGIVGRIPVKGKILCKINDVISAKITRIDKNLKRVYLEAKISDSTEEKKKVDEYIKTHDHTFKLNDVIDFETMKSIEENKDEKDSKTNS